MDLKKLTAQADTLRSMSAKARSQERRWYKIVDQADTAKVYVYDMIGEWGVTAQDFVNEMAAIKSPVIDLHVNSEGGQVFDGIAIYNAIRNHPATVTAYVDALAASAASFMVQAADYRVMAPNARMMIHEAQGVVVGNAEDALTLAALLEDTSENIASIYAERSGKPVEEWRKAMKNETWYGAQDAVDAGLADWIDGAKPAQDKKPANQVVQPTNAESEPVLDFDILSAVKEALK